MPEPEHGTAPLATVPAHPPSACRKAFRSVALRQMLPPPLGLSIWDKAFFYGKSAENDTLFAKSRTSSLRSWIFLSPG
jgi:hypothetical protein